MKVTARRYDLSLEVPFAISRSVTSTRTIWIAEVEHHGIVGYGEASPSAYYGDSPGLAEDVARRHSPQVSWVRVLVLGNGM